MTALSSIIDELTELATDAGALGEERTRTVETTYPPTTATGLTVDTRNGAIDVHPTDGDDVVVEALVRSRRADDDLDGVSLDRTETGDILHLAVAVPEENRATSVDLDVGVPDSLTVDRVSSRNGTIHVRDVRGDVLAETKNGTLTIESVDGVVDAHAKNGEITVRDTQVRDVDSKNGTLDLDLSGLEVDATIQSKNGTVAIRVPADTDADFTLAATHGTASVEGLTCLVEESSRRHVSGELGTGGPLLDARTKNGSLQLRAR